MVRLAALLLAASGASAQERVIATCIIVDGHGPVQISERDGQSVWTETERRVEAQLIRSREEDTILGITANRLDGTIAMLSLERPTKSPAPRRREAALTIHTATGDDIAIESYDAYCDVEANR